MISRAATGDSGVHVDQALFGYRNGHRLLSASTSFDPGVLDVLNRTTDGTGAESVPGFDGYLSGYLLSDGRYALTRTWKAPEAGRPGSVWTHAVFLDLAGRHGDVDPGVLLDALRRPAPGAASPDSYTSQLPLRTDAPTTNLHVQTDWTTRLSALYAPDPGTIWFPTADMADAETELMTVWAWHWPALRQHLSFTVGALGRRSVAGTTFDILVVPAARRVTAATDLGPESTVATPTGTLVAADIRGDMPESFRRFIRFCGAETQNRAAVAVLSEAWLLADDPGTKPLKALQQLTGRVSREFPRPNTMRRLKRALLVEDGRLPAPWSAADQFRALLEPRFAQCVRASDAPLEALLEQNRHNPIMLLEAATLFAPDKGSSGQKLPSVADVLGKLAEPVLAKNAQPSWLPDLTSANPRLALSVLRNVAPTQRPGWADEFWAMDSTLQTSLTTAYTSAMDRADGIIVTASTLGWLGAYGSPDGSIGWFSTAHPRATTRVAGFVDLAAELGRRDTDTRRRYVSTVHDPGQVASCITAAADQSPQIQQALLLLLDPISTTAIESGIEPWALALEDNSPEPVAAAHLLRLVPTSEPTRPLREAAAHAYAHVWEAVARSDWRTWDALGPYPAEVPRQDEWDRGMRVSRSFARHVAAWVHHSGSPETTLPTEVLDKVSAISGRAAAQLRTELTQIFDPPPPPKISKKKKKGAIERAWQMAADVFGFD